MEQARLIETAEASPSSGARMKLTRKRRARSRPAAQSQVIRGLTYEQYHALGGIGSGSLWDLNTSPLYYQWRQTAPREESPALALGSATHTAVLEPMQFLREYALWEGDRRTKEGKAAWEAFGAVNAGKIVLTRDQYDEALAIGEAVHKHKIAKRLLAAGEAELSLTWVDPQCGELCRARPDWLSPTVLLDLKTTRHASPRQFFADAVSRGYHVKMAHYADGVTACTGTTPEVWIIAAQSSPPYDVACYRMTENVLAAGREKRSQLIELLLSCRKSGKWPGVDGGEAQDFVMPAWAVDSGDDDLALTMNGEVLA